MSTADLVTVVFSVLLVACGIAWLIAFMRVRAGERLLPFQPRRPVPWGLFDLLASVFLLAMLGGIALWILGRLGIDPGNGQQLTVRDHSWSLTLGTVSRGGMVVLSVLLITFRTPCRLSDLGVEIRQLPRDFRTGLATFIMVGPIAYAIQLAMTHFWESTHPIVELLQVHPDPVLIGLCSISAVIAAPITEEYLHRLLIQGWLERASVHRGDAVRLLGGESKSKASSNAVLPQTHRPSDRDDGNPYAPPQTLHHEHRPDEKSLTEDDVLPFWPVLVSAAVFALLHIDHGPDFVALFVFALGLGFVYQRTHRIVPCMVAHMLLNACTMGILLIELYRK